jgi:hypothetical protein
LKLRVALLPRWDESPKEAIAWQRPPFGRAKDSEYAPELRAVVDFEPTFAKRFR